MTDTRDRPWTAWPQSRISDLYVQLKALQETVQQLLTDVSGEAWKIGNDNSPRYNNPESSRRRDL